MGSADSAVRRVGSGGLSRCVEVWASTGGIEWFVEAVRIVKVDVGGCGLRCVADVGLGLDIPLTVFCLSGYHTPYLLQQ